jgi:hypothetical protein
MIHGGGTPQWHNGRMKLSPYTPLVSSETSPLLASGVRARAYALDTLYKRHPHNCWHIFTLGHTNNFDREFSSGLAMHNQLHTFGIPSEVIISPTDTLTEIIESTLIAAEAARFGKPIECLAHLSNEYHLPRIQFMDALLHDVEGSEKLKMMVVNSLGDYPDYRALFSEFWEDTVKPAILELNTRTISRVSVSAEGILRTRSSHWNTLIDSLDRWQTEDGHYPWQNRIYIETEGLSDLADGSYLFNAHSIIEYLQCE